MPTRAPLAPPRFASNAEYVSHLGDVALWSPYVAEILQRHDHVRAAGDLTVGFNATYPTFICGDIVVKLFGHFDTWRTSYTAESAALRLAATDTQIAAPIPLATDRLFHDVSAPWPYLITTRIRGSPSWQVNLSQEQTISLAAELGRRVRLLHTLTPSGVVSDADWQRPDLVKAAEQSSLPPHLIAQIDEYTADVGPPDCVFVHGDLIANHIFVDQGRLSGIIDWGDAMVTDRHYELIQLYRDMFNCDKALFRVFLEASEWPIDSSFPRKALCFALHRQAIGLAQHHTMDVFEPIAAALPLNSIATLDDLAVELFAV